MTSRDHDRRGEYADFCQHNATNSEDAAPSKSFHLGITAFSLRAMAQGREYRSRSSPRREEAQQRATRRAIGPLLTCDDLPG